MSDLLTGQRCPRRKASLPIVGEPDVASLIAFLRAAHPRDTAKCVAAAIDAPPETIGNWLKGKAQPSLRHFGRLMMAYGPDLVAATFPNAPAWLDAAKRDARLRKVEEAMAELKAERAALQAAE